MWLQRYRHFDWCPDRNGDGKAIVNKNQDFYLDRIIGEDDAYFVLWGGEPEPVAISLVSRVSGQMEETLKKSLSGMVNGHPIYTTLIEVLPPYRGQGLGYRLVREREKFLEERGLFIATTLSEDSVTRLSPYGAYRGYETFEGPTNQHWVAKKY